MVNFGIQLPLVVCEVFCSFIVSGLPLELGQKCQRSVSAVPTCRAWGPAPLASLWEEGDFMPNPSRRFVQPKLGWRRRGTTERLCVWTTDPGLGKTTLGEPWRKTPAAAVHLVPCLQENLGNTLRNVGRLEPCTLPYRQAALPHSSAMNSVNAPDFFRAVPADGWQWITWSRPWLRSAHEPPSSTD